MRSIAVSLIILILVGCQTPTPQVETSSSTSAQPPINSSESHAVPEPELTQVVINQIQSVNWSASLHGIIERMLKEIPLAKEETLLVDNIKNNSNKDIQVTALTSEFINLLNSTRILQAVDEDKLNNAKEALGLQSSDSLNARSKTIGLARYLSVPYILYITVDGADNDLTLSSQLVQMQTGEIVWSKKQPAVVTP